MFNFPDTEKKVRNRVSNYKSALNKERRNHGYINDGGGKRYLLFYLYFVLNDLKKSEEYFEWYKEEFPDDIGEPIQKLCWALSLHRMEKYNEAKYILADLMLTNLYLIPKVIGKDINEYKFWHSSNYELIDYIEYIPEEILENIEESEVLWMKELYDSIELRRVRKRHIEIRCELQDTKNHEARKTLLNELHSLLDYFEQ